MRRTRRALIIVAFTLVSCSRQVLPAATPTTQGAVLRLFATTPMIPLANHLTLGYSRVNPSVTFDVATGNFEAVMERFSQEPSSYVLTNHAPDETLWAAPLGQDGIAVIVHLDNPIRSLTTEQLRDIYRGQIDHWSEVGGDDEPIIVLTRENGSGTRAEFERLVMGERPTTPTAQIAPSSAAMIEGVARDRGSIGYVSMSYLDRSVQAITLEGVRPSLENVANNTYPLRSIIYIVGEQEPELHYRNFIFWAQSQEGQAVVARRYAPLLQLAPSTDSANRLK